MENPPCGFSATDLNKILTRSYAVGKLPQKDQRKEAQAVVDAEFVEFFRGLNLQDGVSDEVKTHLSPYC